MHIDKNHVQRDTVTSYGNSYIGNYNMIGWQ
jgi:hypothetical protein